MTTPYAQTLVRDMSRSASPVRGLEQRLLDQLNALGLAPGSVIGVAFSGGTDSLALAAGLAKTAPAADVRPLLFHINHQLRPASDADAQRSQELAQRLALPIFVATVDLASLARHQGAGIEESARRERYQLLAQLAQRHGAKHLAVAHQADDQAETVLMHLVRGSGLQGAMAMSRRSELRVPWWRPDDPSVQAQTLSLWRPLLDERRVDLTRYLAHLGLEPIEDESNADPRFLRNRIRHELLPLVNDLREGASAALGRYGQIAADEDRLLTGLTDLVLEQAIDPQGDLLRSQLLAEPISIQRRVIHRWLNSRGVDEPTFERVEAARDLLASPSSHALIEVGGNIVVTRLDNALIAGGPDWIEERRKARDASPARSSLSDDPGS